MTENYLVDREYHNPIREVNGSMKILHELILVIALGMLLTLATGLATAEEEPNDDYANSEEVAPGTITGTMNETDVLDYYKFQAGEGGQ